MRPRQTKSSIKNSSKNNSADRGTVIQNIPKYFILGGLLFFLVTIVLIIKPFIVSLVIGAVIATGFYPVHKKISSFFKHPTIPAIISFIIILTIILVPLSWFVAYITGQAVNTYIFIESKVNQLLQIDIQLIPQIIQDSFIGNYISHVEQFLPAPKDIIGFVTTIIQNLSQFLVNQTTNFAKQLSVLAIQIFVLLLSIFFFLRDGDRAIHEIKNLIPLASKYRDEVFNKLHAMSQGILYGMFGAAMAQGLLGGTGFAIAGIENSAFWGTIMAFSALVPYVGATLIWVPAAIVLFATSHWVAALFLILWGSFVIGTIDNFIKPIVIGEKARIHPLLSFLAILGGIFTMGLPGLILAPYLLSLTLAFLHIYKLEYHQILDVGHPSKDR
ncbi:MAG: membrane protein [Candidatus Peregrinibacteria bacterium GW2011_GWE2_39_6]|nr:MAG: membrane protein [Candidatus Peregrinibacteria bacterium GW2011_GWF2_39_17]KKR23438.1 MAG: membrane protein [Candidatus Peregrinibacteria bacterium GW2011_GWE2_39_6]HCW32346.1 hypothetical protein [Candidatus Peregrinibacteria bacterium]